MIEPEGLDGWDEWEEEDDAEEGLERWHDEGAVGLLGVGVGRHLGLSAWN